MSKIDYDEQDEKLFDLVFEKVCCKMICLQFVLVGVMVVVFMVVLIVIVYKVNYVNQIVCGFVIIEDVLNEGLILVKVVFLEGFKVNVIQFFGDCIFFDGMDKVG